MGQNLQQNARKRQAGAKRDRHQATRQAQIKHQRLGQRGGFGGQQRLQGLQWRNGDWRKAKQAQPQQARQPDQRQPPERQSGTG